MLEQNDPRMRFGRRAFIGRHRELDLLLAGLEEAAAERGCLYLVVGEAGIGKTRLTEELARDAATRGAVVLRGRCWRAEGAPPYWPWVQALRPYLQSTKPEALTGALGGGAPYVARLFPEIRERFPGLPAAPTSPESEHARFYLFDAITTFLKNIADAAPLALVFDDLQWADIPSLLLLRFVAHQVHDARVLLVGTYREGEVRQTPAVAEILGSLARDGRHLPLRGLGEEEVGLFIEAAAGYSVAEDLVRTVWRQTEGNPLFVDETVRALAAAGVLDRGQHAIPAAGLPIPQGVRAAIRGRLTPLPSTCRRVLAVASVIGREFDLGCLQRTSNLQPNELLDVLGDAVTHEIVFPDIDTPGQYRFSHALIRDALYDDLLPADRATLHGQVGATLEARYAVDLEPHLASIAHHFLEAIPGGSDAEKGVAYAVLAGDRAAATLAHEEAVELYRRALGALALHDADDATRRCTLLLALAQAQWRTGEASTARETFRQAADGARRIPDPILLAHAALGLGGEHTGLLWAESGVFDQPLVGLLEEALGSLGERAPTLRARLLARLAISLYHSPFPERGIALSTEAVALARRHEQPRVLATALLARCVALWGPDGTREQLAVASEVISLAEQTGDRELAIAGHRFRILGFLERGDVEAANGEVEAWVRTAGELRQPYYVGYAGSCQATIATLEGRFADAEQHIEAFRELGRRLGDLDLTPGIVVSSGGVCIHQGRFREFREALGSVAGPHAGLGVWPYFAAVLDCELGRTERARRALAALAEGDGLRNVPRTATWLFRMCAASVVSASLGDVGTAAVLYDLLAPYAGRIALVGPPSFCFGAVSHTLGELAATLGCPDDGLRHFLDALTELEGMGARPLVAGSQYACARTLLARGASGDTTRAAKLLSSALTIAEELAMPALVAKIRALGPSSGCDVASSRGDSAGAANEGCIFRREGEFWTIAYEDAVLRLQDIKGLRYIAYLLRHPGREFHAMDLAAAVEREAKGLPPGAPNLVSDATRLGDAGEVLDAPARRAYRARVAELRSELAEAEEFNDPGRATRARDELDALTSELAGAVGLGGRARRAASPSERARVSITNRIRLVLRKIDDQHAPLGSHLRNTIRTGTFLSYVPDPSAPVSWAL